MKKVSTLALQYIWINWSTTFSFYWHGLSKLNWLKQVYINIFILFDRWYAESLSYYSAFTGITTSQVIVWNIVLEKMNICCLQHFLRVEFQLFLVKYEWGANELAKQARLYQSVKVFFRKNFFISSLGTDQNASLTINITNW